MDKKQKTEKSQANCWAYSGAYLGGTLYYVQAAVIGYLHVTVRDQDGGVARCQGQEEGLKLSLRWPG